MISFIVLSIVTVFVSLNPCMSLHNVVISLVFEYVFVNVCGRASIQSCGHVHAHLILKYDWSSILSLLYK